MGLIFPLQSLPLLASVSVETSCQKKIILAELREIAYLLEQEGQLHGMATLVKRAQQLLPDSFYPTPH